MSNNYSIKSARRATIAGLLRGRVYHHCLSTGETVTLGRYTPAVRTDSTPGYVLYGYRLGGCREEHFQLATQAADRLLALSRA